MVRPTTVSHWYSCYSAPVSWLYKISAVQRTKIKNKKIETQWWTEVIITISEYSSIQQLLYITRPFMNIQQHNIFWTVTIWNNHLQALLFLYCFLPDPISSLRLTLFLPDTFASPLMVNLVSHVFCMYRMSIWLRILVMVSSLLHTGECGGARIPYVWLSKLIWQKTLAARS